MTSFPRQMARTRRFTLGVPRAVRIAPDGRRLTFLRTAAGDDPVTALWTAEITPDGLGQPVCLVDPRQLGDTDHDLPAAERARRERAREVAGGITAYAADPGLSLLAFGLGGRLWTVHLASGAVVEHPAGGVFDPRPAPDARSVACVSHDELHLLELVAGPGQPGVTRPIIGEQQAAWGRAEFIAAEEMGRSEGYWWGPHGRRIAATRVDETEVARWYLGDPATPWEEPTELRYPRAGSANAEVRLAVLDLEGTGRRVDVAWDREAFPYLARVRWGSDPLTLQVQSRDQRCSRVLVADPDTGVCEPVREVRDPAWVEPVPGAPCWSAGRLVTVEDRPDHGPGGSRAVLLDGEVLTPPGLQVHAMLAASDTGLVFLASNGDPTQRHLWGWQDHRGLHPIGEHPPGVQAGVARAGIVVRTQTTLDRASVQVDVLRADAASDAASDADPAAHAVIGELPQVAEVPVVQPSVRLLELGPRRLRAALLLPTQGPAAASDAGPLPVLLDPYGGPHAQRVLRSQPGFLTSQWFADQGFAVLVVDGRGTPGRGPAWEREVRGDLAGPVLEDQLDALREAAAIEPRLDLRRVGIRGWSFGGTLALLAVLRAPEVVHAAVAGAPVTDWRLYDTHYTERYLGDPARDPHAYDTSSLIDAEGVLRPAAPWSAESPPGLLLIHGLADDNVVAAHAVRLSAALLAEGRAHRFLPLSGVTHVTGEASVTERLLEEQVRFLRRELGDAR